MDIKFPKTKKIKGWLGKFLKKIAEKAFIVYIIMVFFASIFGGAVFHKYAASIQNVPVKSPEKITKFDEATYQRILSEWSSREVKFFEVDSKFYTNPFEGQLPEELTNR